jgi:hypothetical protein
MNAPVQPTTGGSLTPAGSERRFQAPLAVWALVVVLVAGTVGAIYLLATDDPENLRVWVPKTDLPVFHQIRPGEVELRLVAKGRAPSLAIRRRDQVVGHYTLAKVRRGEPLTQERLGPFLRRGAIASSMIVGIETTRSGMLGGRLERGSYVDLLLVPRQSQPALEPVKVPGVLILDVLPADATTRAATVVVAVDRAQEKALGDLGRSTATFVLPERRSAAG